MRIKFHASAIGFMAPIRFESLPDWKYLDVSFFPPLLKGITKLCLRCYHSSPGLDPCSRRLTTSSARAGRPAQIHVQEGCLSVLLAERSCRVSHIMLWSGSFALHLQTCTSSYVPVLPNSTWSYQDLHIHGHSDRCPLKLIAVSFMKPLNKHASLWPAVDAASGARSAPEDRPSRWLLAAGSLGAQTLILLDDLVNCLPFYSCCLVPIPVLLALTPARPHIIGISIHIIFIS